MVAVTTRESYGAELPWQIVDANFINLATAIDNIGDDVLAEAIIAKDAAVLAATASQSSAASSAASAQAAATSAAAFNAPNGSTLIGFLADGVGAVLRRVFDKLLETVSVKDYGAVSNGVTNDAAAIVKANTKAGKRPLVFIGVSHIGTQTTITAPISDTMEQIFSATSQVTIDNGRPIRPEWFGSSAGNIRLAVNATPARGGTVLLRDATYPPSYNTATGAMFNNRGGTPGLDYMVKKNVCIVGARVPAFADDNSQLVNGSIIQGPLFVSSEASGFFADKLGVDSGNTVQSQLGLSLDDALCFLQTNKAAPVYGSNVNIGHVIALCSDTALGHACLFEAIDGGTIDYAEGRNAAHGVVVKSRNVVFNSFAGSLNRVEDVIFKSDDYANLKNVQGSNVRCTGPSSGNIGAGLIIQAVGAIGASVQISNVRVSQRTNGVTIESRNSFAMTDVFIGDLITDNCGTPYSVIGGAERSRCDNICSSSSTAAAVFVDAATTSRSNSIGRLDVNSSLLGVYLGGKVAIENAFFNGVTQESINFYNLNARAKIGNFDLTGAGPVWNAYTQLQGAWAQHPGGGIFSLVPKNGGVVMSGLLRNGAATLIAQIGVQICPSFPIRAPAVAYNGSVYTTVEILITPGGDIYTSNFAASSGASGYLSLDGISWPTTF